LVLSELEKTFKKRLKKHYKNVVELKNIVIFVFKKHKKQINMKTTLNQQAPIFWKGQLCKFIKWESLTFGGKLKIKINKKFIEADINELSN
jgi:hypothetical protein